MITELINWNLDCPDFLKACRRFLRLPEPVLPKPPRICEKILTLSTGEIFTPNEINNLASSAAHLASAIMLHCKTYEDAFRLSEAVDDNWKRFIASC